MDNLLKKQWSISTQTAADVLLLAELSHPNGWRRDTAQRLIVLRHDDTVIPALESLARAGHSPLGRIHALWTLDGLGAVPQSLIEASLKDTDPRVQQTAIRLSESHLAKSPELVEQVAAAGFNSDISVTVQAINLSKEITALRTK